MKELRTRSTALGAVALALLLAVSGQSLPQTKVKAPGNPYSPAKDVELGEQAAAEVERQLPILRDSVVERYVESIGANLVESIPSQFRHSEFKYSFDVVNASDINAFALPGGFTYVNRGLIEAANTEGELAGVMAHEISHVALRHGTAQAAKAQKYSIGAAAGAILGSIIGGGLGSVIAQGSQFGIGTYFLKFSREYERQADTLGAQIMARAGYDPRELATMFQTIEREGRSGGPEWLSSHPNPGNRYESINREADLLRVRDPIRNTREFNRIRSRLRDMPAARSMSDISRGGSRDSGSRRSGGRVEYPSSRYRTHRVGDVFRVSVPENWRELSGSGSVTYAPEGAYGRVRDSFVFTHGAMLGLAQARSTYLREATEGYLNELARSNSNLRRRGRYQRTGIDGREGLAISLTNISEVTGREETVTLYTTLLRGGELFYVITVAPRDEARYYQRAFGDLVRSIDLNR